MRITPWLLIGTVLAGLAASAGADPAAAPAPDLSAANQHWTARADLAEARQAVAAFQAVTVKSPEAYEAWWRLARACWWLGENVPQSERIAIYDQGKAAAEQAVKLDPKRIEGHYWLGVCLGRTGEERGILNSLFMVDPIAKEMESCLSLDPKYGQAQHVLGVLYRKAPGWPISRGDINKSLAFAQQAVANDPELVLSHLGLAETLTALGRKDEAKQELTKSLELPGPTDEQPETAKDKEKVRADLKDLQ